MLTIADRFKEYLRRAGVKQSDFLREVGKSRAYFASAGNLSTEMLSRIVKLYPDLNAEWLLTGEGEMLKSSAGTEPDSDVARLAAAVARLAAAVEALTRKLS